MKEDGTTSADAVDLASASTRAITVELCGDLLKRGYAVADNFFSATGADALRMELLGLHADGILKPNQVAFQTSGGPVHVTKPHIFEGDMHSAVLQSAAPGYCKIFADDSLAHALNTAARSFACAQQQQQQQHSHQSGETAATDGGVKDAFAASRTTAAFSEGTADTRLGLTLGTSAKTVKLQYNEGGGGCFPWHYDNPSRPNKRRVTMLVYLNPEWSQGDGGEVVLAPFLGHPVRVAPRHNRAVFFLSDRVLHRVLPSEVPRCCFTIWLDSEHTNSETSVFLKAKHLVADSIPLLCATPLQRTLSRAVYAEAYVRSLKECFVSGKSLKLSLALHTAHLKQLLGNVAVASFVDILRARAAPLDDDGSAQFIP